MAKQLYRTVENLLEEIDHSAGDEQMLEDILHLLVESDEMTALGVVSGRLYKERPRDFKLTKSISGHGPGIIGRTVSKDYQVVRDLQHNRLWVMTPDSPGWDPKVEAQFGDLDSAAIIVGREPSYILSLGIRHHGSEDDLRVLLESIRASIGLKLREQALAGQMEQARIIQQSLEPAHLPHLDGFEFAAISRPAEVVGGDVYDLQEVEDGVVGLLLADASGHGLPAALQARDVVIGMRMGIAEGEKITTTVSRLNRVIHRSGLTSRFISLFYCELEETGNLAYVNGGHCPPLILTPDGEVFELKTSGPVLGPLPDAVYRRGFLNLRPGEVLVLFSDGVTERLQPDPGNLGDDTEGEQENEIVEFGREGLIRVAQACLDRSAEEIAKEILAQVMAFGGDQAFDDDVSLMVIKRLPAENYPPSEALTRLSVQTNR
ncbi:MAG: PP2C family protein-serine/threonine phosphatase [Gemmatimonadales bacterium]|nr:PP2C family protein-serine/threonine phosphatase [Gemmatimonadales bacterium]